MSVAGSAVAMLGAFTLLYASVLALAAAVRAVRGRGPGTACTGGAVLLELTLAVRAVLDGATLTASTPVAEPVVHAGYLVTSVSLLPMLAAVTRVPGERPDTGSDSAVLAVGCVAVAVVALRLTVTGRPPDVSIPIDL